MTFPPLLLALLFPAALLLRPYSIPLILFLLLPLGSHTDVIWVILPMHLSHSITYSHVPLHFSPFPLLKSTVVVPTCTHLSPLQPTCPYSVHFIPQMPTCPLPSTTATHLRPPSHSLVHHCVTHSPTCPTLFHHRYPYVPTCPYLLALLSCLLWQRHPPAPLLPPLRLVGSLLLHLST